MIPKIIHQVWVKYNGDIMPEFIEKATETIKNKNPDFVYMFHGPEVVDEFNLQEEYKKSTAAAFFADVVRVKVLEKYGGIYIDCDYQCNEPISDLYDKHKNKILVSNSINNFVDLSFIMAEPNLDYTSFLVDFELDEPSAFYWQRMKPFLLLEEDVGTEGKILKDLRLNSWVDGFLKR